MLEDMRHVSECLQISTSELMRRALTVYMVDQRLVLKGLPKGASFTGNLGVVLKPEVVNKKFEQMLRSAKHSRLKAERRGF